LDFIQALLLAVLVACLSPLHSYAKPPVPKLAIYRSAEHRFAISYPSSWQQFQPNTSLTKFKAADLEAGDACTVAVHFSEVLRNLDTKESLKSMNAQVLVRQLSNGGLNNVSAIESGHTTLSNRAAFYAVLNATQSAMGTDFPHRSIMVITNKKGFVYTLTCATTPARFDRMRPLFTAILSTFVLDP
jgi:hypothetical protein